MGGQTFVSSVKVRVGATTTLLVTDPNQLVGGNAGSVTPAVSCEPAIITPCLFNPTETPGTREVRVQIESTNMAPSGSNTGWTQLANITIGGVVFAQYSTTVTVPAKTAAEIPLSNPFSFTITVANTPARFQVFRVAAHEVTYFGQAQSDAFYELSGNIGAALTAALFPASAVCNTASNVNKDFMITGNLTINSNFCFDFTMLPNGSVRRGRVFVQPGRTITVNGGATLSVLSADVVGCELLHGGIIIQNSGTVVMTGAEVRDAVTAVTVEKGGTLRVGGSRFFNNITGIKLDGNAGTATAPPAMPVCTTNVFGAWLVDGAEIRLKPLGGGTIGYPRPLYGMDFRNAGLVLASSNFYRRMATYGVQATNTTLDLLTSFFSDINQAGIYFSGKNNLTVTGFGGLANSFRAFDLCPTSIICTNAYGINITNCRMTNTNTGIFLIRNTSPEATIRSNRIEASFHGIRTNMNGRIDPHSQGIRDNSIVINGNNTNSVGVGFEEFPLNSTHSLHWRLQDNTINMQSARQGIKATSGNKYWMLRNTVSVANTTQPDAEGIRLQDVRDSKIECNLVTLNNGGNDNLFPGSTKGYYSASGRTNDFLCNTADNTYYGMQFFDAALDIDMKANAIGNHRYGLALGTENGGASNDQVTIGQQGTAQSGNGNQWEVNEFAPTTTRTGAKHWSSKAAIWGLSRFFVSDNSNCPTLNPTKNPPANWFTENVPNCQTNHTCNPNCPPPAGGPASESDWLSGEIAAGRTAAAGLLPAGVAKLEAKLFAQLSERAGMMGENEDYPLFYETRNEGNIGKFYNVEVGIGQLFHLAASDSASLRTHRTELDTLMAQIRAMNEAEATSPIDENARQQLYQSARTHDAAIQALLDSLQSERIVAASSLITQNANIVPSEVWEFNQQFVNEFFLTLVAGAEPSGQQVEDLAVIAAACPLTDGDAVYQARSLYAPYNEEAIYDDDNLCQDIEERAAHTRTKRPTGLAVFPNPGQEVFTLTGLMPGAYELDVYDGRGILVLHTVGTERTFRVPGLTCTRPSCAKKAAARRRSSSPSSAESIPSPCPARASSPRAGWAYFLFSMKKTLLLACWAVLSAAYGQRNDFKWVLGYDYDPNTPGTDNILFDFNPNLMEFNYEDRNIEFVGTNAIICDDGGEVKIYTNGCQMYEKDGEMILNSDSINIGYAYQEFCVNQGAYRTIDASMLLPAPERPGFYYYITDGNYYDLTISPIVAYTARLSYNLIDMNAEGGLGRVVEKNVPLLYDTLTGGQIEAVKHANGRDWWVVVPIYNTNIYRFFLVSPSGVALHHSQAIGNKCTYQTVCCQAIFSPDGSKYSRYSNLDDLFIFDFDRCEGVLSNFKYVEVQDTLPSDGGLLVNCSGLSVSPNSKYLYLTNLFDLMQFDLTSDDPASTRQDVAHYDGWSGYEYLCWSQLAPDGKIYITTGNGTRHMHVVHSPDEFGTACEPQISAYKFQKPKFDLPNLPNYRLGPLDGSPCDTLGLDNRPWAHWRWRPEAQALRTVVFRDLSAYEPDTWHWDFGDGTQSDERNPTHTFPTAGDYYVCLTVSNQYGSDTFCRWVTVTTVGTDEAAPGLRASVSPNPATDHFEVRLSGPLPAGGRLSLFDVAGRPVLSEAFEAGTVTARVGLPEGQPPGVYFWQLAAGARVLAKGRVVKVDK